jgi:hypothetical protein
MYSYGEDGVLHARGTTVDDYYWRWFRDRRTLSIGRDCEHWKLDQKNYSTRLRWFRQQSAHLRRISFLSCQKGRNVSLPMATRVWDCRPFLWGQVDHDSLEGFEGTSIICQLKWSLQVSLVPACVRTLFDLFRVELQTVTLACGLGSCLVTS